MKRKIALIVIFLLVVAVMQAPHRLATAQAIGDH